MLTSEFQNPQRAEAGSLQDRIAHRVVIDLTLVVGMLAAIDLDDQAVLEADEVEIEAAAAALAGGKWKPSARICRSCSQQAGFLRGQGFAQLTSAFRCGLRDFPTLAALRPVPPHEGEGGREGSCLIPAHAATISGVTSPP